MSCGDDLIDSPQRAKQESALDLARLPADERERLESLTPEQQADELGVSGKDTADEDSPNLISLSNERLIRKGNVSLRLGKDRHTDRRSGFGGKGNTHCAAIDIVAGHLGTHAKKRNKKGKAFYCNPDFQLDAARIYISQKSNVDGYFNIARNKKIDSGLTSYEKPRSAIALKADVVRVIGRENIKLITRTDKRNSQNGELTNMDKSAYGIDLIAMNDATDLQPLVKGHSLVECIESVLQLVTNVSTILDNFVTYQQGFNKSIQAHTHMSPFYGSETAPDFKQLMMEGVNNAVSTALNCQVPMIADIPLNNVGIINDYLADSGAPGDKYILSLYNRTN
jgi:hypothetical protein